MRRNRIELQTLAERKIADAIAIIETEMSADERLTKAQVLLEQASEELGNYVDERLRAELGNGP